MTTMSHLSDDRLVEVCMLGAAAAHEERHLAECARCHARRGDLIHLLDDIAQASEVETDAAFSADRLARQRARILHRLEQDGRPARVLAFPASRPQQVPYRPRSVSRWVAAAAVAGLVIGLLAGRLGHDGTLLTHAPLAGTARSTATTLQASTASISDDELLGQIEVAIAGRGGAALGPLDDLTPTAWEAR